MTREDLCGSEKEGRQADKSFFSQSLLHNENAVPLCAEESHRKEKSAPLEAVFASSGADFMHYFLRELFCSRRVHLLVSGRTALTLQQYDSGAGKAILLLTG